MCTKNELTDHGVFLEFSCLLDESILKNMQEIYCQDEILRSKQSLTNGLDWLSYLVDLNLLHIFAIYLSSRLKNNVKY